MITPPPWSAFKSAVVVPDPEMSLSCCGLPVSMSLALWRLHLLHRLLASRRVITLDDAQDYLTHDPQALELLQEVMQERPILLRRDQPSREPPLLWMSPRLVQGEAIHLHPLLMQRWSLHAEGEHLSARVLLSPESSAEAQQAFGPSASFVSRLSWRPSLSLSKQACVGLFALTHQVTPTTRRRYVSMAEALLLYRQGLITHTEEICLRYQGQRVVTTVGRALLAEVAPLELPFEALNQAQTIWTLSSLMQRCLFIAGASQAESLMLSLESLGVEHATRAGLSLCINDFVQAPDKNKILGEARRWIDSVYEQLDEGLLLEEEKTNKVIDLWSRALEQVRASAIASLRAAQNALWLYTEGVGWQTYRRLLSAFGFIGKGHLDEEGRRQIQELPVLESLREGLPSLSFFYSAQSSRASMLSVMALEEENAASQETLSLALRDVVLTQDDCGTSDGVVLSGPSWPTARVNFATQMVGRVLAQDVASLRIGHRLSRGDAEALRDAGVDSLKVRSSLACAAPDGVCAACYGAPLSPGRGVGLLAAQAFELNHQRWDRDLHVEREAVALQRGVVRFHNARVITNKAGARLLISRRATWSLCDKELPISDARRLPYGAELLVNDGELVTERQALARWNPCHLPLLAERPGVLRYQDLSLGINYEEYINQNTGLISRVVRTPAMQVGPAPSLQVQDSTGEQSATYPLRWSSTLLFDDGAEVSAGDVLAERYKYSRSRQHRPLRELLEAAPPKESATLASIDGLISILAWGEPNETLVRITANDGKTREQIVTTTRLEVEDGDEVLRGDRLSGGDDDPHLILQTLGERAAKQHLLRELQERLEADGVGLPMQHIEVLLREMFGYEKINAAGEIGHRQSKKREQGLSPQEQPPNPAPILLGVSALAWYKINKSLSLGLIG